MDMKYLRAVVVKYLKEFGPQTRVQTNGFGHFTHISAGCFAHCRNGVNTGNALSQKSVSSL